MIGCMRIQLLLHECSWEWSEIKAVQGPYPRFCGAALDQRSIRTKVNGRRRQSGGIRFGAGTLAHLLKNRFYIGEVAYRGEVHRGEHEPILGRDVFEAVQEARPTGIEPVFPP
jgi:Recombinase